ncbi:MAG: sensor histidine kinase, partial [Dokdonella sp.]
AARHSGADNVWLRLARDGERLVLEIRDDGRGARNLRVGNGVRGMCERLEDIGGGIEFDSVQGFRLNAWVPTR